MFEKMNQIDRNLRERLETVADKAIVHNDRGVFDWVQRAVNDALFLGRMRDRDVANLQRLEDTYNDDFYNGNSRTAVHA